MGFYLKKVIGWFLDPLSVAFVLGVLGLVLVLRRPSRRAAVPLVLSVLILLASSYDPLVRRFSAIVELTPTNLPTTAPSVIVVLGTGVSDSTWPTAVSRLEPQAVARLATGIELAQRHPDAILAVCGHTPDHGIGPAGIMHDAAIALGIAQERIRPLREPRDTRAEAAAVAALIQSEALDPNHVWLVTSSVHLRRARAFFRAAGIDPLPVAAEPYGSNQPLRFLPPLPSSGTLNRASALSHEVFGILWALVRQQFKISDLQ